MNLTMLASILFALVVSLVFGRNASVIGHKLDVLDFPDTDGGRKRHELVTPMVGGTAIVLSSLFSTFAVCWCGAGIGPSLRQTLLGFAVAVFLMFASGFADDRFGLSPALRLVLSSVVLLLTVMSVPDFNLSVLRFSGQQGVWLVGAGGAAFVLLCLVGLLNAVNMADGKDGIVISMGLVWTVVLAFHLPQPMLPILAATGVALAVMLWFNMRQHLFVGDAGSYAISTQFGLLAIYAYNHDFAVMRADDVAVMFAIPVYDTIRLMVARKLAGRSMFEADRDHLHHHLHRSFGWPRGLFIYVAMVAIPNILALAMPGTGLIWLVAAAFVYGFVLWITRYTDPRFAE